MVPMPQLSSGGSGVSDSHRVNLGMKGETLVDAPLPHFHSIGKTMPAKTSVTTTNSRKRRSRKSAAKVTPTAKAVVVKEVQEIAPPAPKLTLADYREDIQARIRIHNYEVNNLVKDVQKGYNFILPFGKKAYNYVTNLVAE